MKRLLLVFLLWLPTLAFAEDKRACTVYGNNIFVFASLRETMTQEALMNRILSMAAEKKWATEATLQMLYMIQYVYYSKDQTPEQIKQDEIKNCMAQAGHQEV